MKTGKNIFSFLHPVFVLCGLLAFGMILSGCNDSDDNDGNTTGAVETTAWYTDIDGDGYGDPDITLQAETQPAGYVSDNTDCNDNDPGIHPGTTEICGDAVDQDCDDRDPICEMSIYYKDADEDGYSDGTTLKAGTQPESYFQAFELISISDDCDDSDANVNPGATEVCNDGIDNDCNGNIDCNDYVTTQAPVADAGGLYSADVGASVSLDGLGSSDADGWITDYAWDLDNDGQYDDANGVTANFTESSAGTYTVSLQVMDNDGMTDTDTVTVKVSGGTAATITYAIVDTGQGTCYDDSSTISAPLPGDAFYGQDAQHDGNQPSYMLSADGLTVDDNVTGLTWTQSPDWNGDGDIDSNDKCVFADFLNYADMLNNQNYGGYSDWRTPTIKELYSLIDFRGTDPNPMSDNSSGLTSFIDTDYFDFNYGDMAAGERVIDAQFWSRTEYVSTTMNDQATTFGVNFADGRIKGYGRIDPRGKEMDQYALFVRSNIDYGLNKFIDNGDGTISDSATGLMWSQGDSITGMNWEDALAWVQAKNEEIYLGHNDWRLPNAKELQSIVDYERSPDTTASAAIDTVFTATEITNEAGDTDYAFYWSGTTFLRFGGSANSAVYVSFGRGLGSMNGTTVIDVHGAGCQRSDPKDGGSSDFPRWGFGPQGDVQRAFNYVRLVRNAGAVN